MTYQDRVDIDTLYDLVYDSQLEQLKVVTKEEFEQLFGTLGDLTDKFNLYPDKSEVYFQILDVLKDAGIITDDMYNELVRRVVVAEGKADDAQESANQALGEIGNTSTSGTIKYNVNKALTDSNQAKRDSTDALTNSQDALDEVDNINQEIGDTSTSGTIKYNVNKALTDSNQAKNNSTEAINKSTQAVNTSNSAIDEVNRLDVVIGDVTTVGTVRYDVNKALTDSSQAISDSSDAYALARTADGKADDLRTDVGTVSGGNLQSQINTVDGKADDLRDDVGTVTGDDLQTQVTTVNNTASNAQTTANTANGNATTALSTANTADGKANQLRTDVGTVNQPDDGSLQEQITYLPAYISELIVTTSRSTTSMGLPIFSTDVSSSGWYIGFRLTELAKKTIRDNGSITFTIEINKPDDSTETINHTINNPSIGSIPSIVKIPYPNFLNLWGVSLITCENLKYFIFIGGVSPRLHSHAISNITNLQTTLDGKSNNGHTHTKSEITDFSHSHSISDITNLQSSLNGKANSTHSHTLSDISDYTDSDWQSFPYTSSAEDFSTSNKIMYRAKGDTIVITGVGKLTSSLSASASVVIGSFVSDYAPSVPVYAPWTGNNQQGYIMVGTDGNVTLYNRNGSSGTMSAGNYFVIDCSYII